MFLQMMIDIRRFKGQKHVKHLNKNEWRIIMDKSIKDYYKKVRKYSDGVTKVAVAGGSGAGKTTSSADLMEGFARQFIFSNIGAIQSSKLRLVEIPVCPNDFSKNTCSLDICFMENPDTDIFMKVIRSSIVEKLVLAYRSFDEEDDVENIVMDIINPGNRAYDVTKYCTNDNKESLKRLIGDLCNQLISGNDVFSNLFTRIDELRAESEKKVGMKFNLKDSVKRELEERISFLELVEIKEEVLKIVSNIRVNIINKVEELREEGLDIESEGNIISVYIDQYTGKLANELFKFIFEKDGKDMVISHLVYIVSMSDKIAKEFYPIVSKELMPRFKLYDLKGLEAGADSISETILKLRESMPDAILAYHRANDISDYFMKFISEIQNEFKTVPFHVILSHSDEAIKSYLRTSLQSFGAVAEGTDGYEKFYEDKVGEAYNRLKDECRIYEDKIGEVNKTKEKQCTVIYCSFVNENEKIDNILGDNKLYCPEKIVKLILDICKYNEKLWKISVPVGLKEQVEKISLSFDVKKLQDFSTQFVRSHKALANKQYYDQKKLYPHWNTVYKWRDAHRVCSGWTSSAKVYDNISIYISNVISGIINRQDISDAILINFPDDINEEQRKDLEPRLKNKIRDDLKSYNGLFYKIKFSLSYGGLKEDFNSTYYSNALQLIYDKLNSADYVERSLNEALKEYAPSFLLKIFG